MATKSLSTSGFKSYSLSDQGVRVNNEDEIHADDSLGIYFVIDGMGGHAAGEQAARIAKERLLGRLNRATGSPQQRIREAITLANNAIFEAGEQNAEWKGMACVLTVALVTDGTATIGHVGDSRLYKLLDGPPEKVTRDHSPVGELEDSAELSEAEAMTHPRRNEVYRDVGSAMHDPDDKDFIDIYTRPAEPESAFLLCSDGLTDALPQAEIDSIIRANLQDPSAGVRLLVDQAKNRDAKDNISVVLVEGPAFGQGDPAPVVLPPQEVEKQLAIPAPIIIEKRAPLWRRIALAVVWMALGAAAFFAYEHWLPQPPSPPPQKTAQAPDQGSKPVAVKADALASAKEGDTIQLAPGIYDDPVTIDKSDILLDGGGAVLRPKGGLIISKVAGIRIRNLRVLTGIHIADSQVTLTNVYAANSTGPALVVRGTSAVSVGSSTLAGKGIVVDSSAPIDWAEDTFINNGGPVLALPEPPSEEFLTHNLFGLDGRAGRAEDVRVTRKRARK